MKIVYIKNHNHLIYLAFSYALQKKIILITHTIRDKEELADKIG